MRSFPDPFDSPDERAADLLDAFDLEEVGACAWLRVPVQLRRGLAAGRLRMTSDGLGFGRVRLVHRRLAFRANYAMQKNGLYVVLLHEGSGAVVRLPFA